MTTQAATDTTADQTASQLFSYEERINTLYRDFLDHDADTLDIAVSIGGLLQEVESHYSRPAFINWRRDHTSIHGTLANQFASLHAYRDRLRNEPDVGFNCALKLVNGYRREEARREAERREAERRASLAEHAQALHSDADQSLTTSADQVEQVVRALMALPQDAVVEYARHHTAVAQYFRSIAYSLGHDGR